MERRTKTPQRKEPSRRYARESQQEDRSEGQIFERFAELGWPRSRMGRDLGEDLLVQICDEGRATGLSFYVQLKSAANAERLRRKKSPALAYPLEVKDLIHWEVSTTLVFLVIWDVERHEGWWQSVPEILRGLDEAKKGWRKRKTATVTVPLTNTTDDEGMARLRWAVADHCLPLVPQKGDMRAKLSFPATEAGRAAVEALERLIDFGDAAEIPAKFITEIQEPQWMQRLYGRRPPSTRSLHFSSIPSSMSLSVRIEIESPDGNATLQHVELRVKSHGRKRVVLSNELQETPIKAELIIERPEGPHQVHFAISQCPDGVYEALDAAQFELALSSPGSTLQIIDLKTGATLWQAAMSTPPTDDLTWLRHRREFLDKLCFIQRRVASQGTISLRSKMTRDDAAAVKRVFAILSSGREPAKLSINTRVPPTASSQLKAQVANAQSKHFSFGVSRSEPIKLLNVELSLGEVRFVPSDATNFAAMYAGKMRDAAVLKRPVALEVNDLPVFVEYLDWLPAEARWERLSTVANRQDGYVTLSQVRQLGYSDDIFFALVPPGKVRRVAADVYHLAQFPRAEREDLLVLWLQTDREGVLSHETALSLHDLCDILPAHLHITVPLGWTSRDRALESDVEIRHADIPEADLRWLGAVPYTSALRTLRDCIEVGVSPELIEQAIAEGIRRGLFAAADLPPHGHARSA